MSTSTEAHISGQVSPWLFPQSMSSKDTKNSVCFRLSTIIQFNTNFAFLSDKETLLSTLKPQEIYFKRCTTKLLVIIQLFISSISKAKGSNWEIKKVAVSFDIQHLNSEKSGIYFPAGRLSKSKLQKGQEALKCEPCWKQIKANKLHQLATWKYRQYISEEDKEGSWGKPSWAVFTLNLGSVHRKGTFGCQVAINTQCEVGGLGAVVRTARHPNSYKPEP